MIKIKRSDLAFYIAFLFYMFAMFAGLAVFYFTTAIGIAIFVLLISYYAALKWLNYVWPPKSKEELHYGKSN